jgi:N-acetylglucosamine malate deacetylase 2
MKNCLLAILLFCSISAFAQPKILVVIAHPDDETAFAATLYKVNKEMKGSTDVAVLSNGEGGYKYSTLAEAYYNLELTDTAIGRRYLPIIRKRELLNAGKIIGVEDFYFFDQKDDKYGLDIKAPLDTFWNVKWVKERLKGILLGKKYDYLFCLLPSAETHGQHKAATVIALQCVSEIGKEQRPVVLGSDVWELNDTLKRDTNYHTLPGYNVTALKKNAPVFMFNRNQQFGFKKVLNYKVVVNWEIAEHKSQGTMQLAMNKGDLEKFYYFDINDATKLAATQAFFDSLKTNPYPVKTY